MSARFILSRYMPADLLSVSAPVSPSDGEEAGSSASVFSRHSHVLHVILMSPTLIVTHLNFRGPCRRRPKISQYVRRALTDD